MVGARTVAEIIRSTHSLRAYPHFTSTRALGFL